MIPGVSFETIRAELDELQDEIEDPDEVNSHYWEGTAFEWLAGRVWMNWWITYYPERKVRIYVDKAGPEMRAHP